MSARDHVQAASPAWAERADQPQGDGADQQAHQQPSAASDRAIRLHGR
jgi:hypothetical protein